MPQLAETTGVIVEVRQIDAFSAEFEGVLDVRFRTDYKGLRGDSQQMREAADYYKNVTHFLAEQNDEAVGSLRLKALAHGMGLVERVRVIPEMQRRGIGHLLLATCEHSAQDMGLDALILTPRKGTAGFYVPQGYMPHIQNGRQSRYLKKALA